MCVGGSASGYQAGIHLQLLHHLLCLHICQLNDHWLAAWHPCATVDGFAYQLDREEYTTVSPQYSDLNTVPTDLGLTASCYACNKC